MINQNQNKADTFRRIPVLIGAAMLTVGTFVLVDQYLGTGWLPWAAIGLAGFLFLIEGARSQKLGWLIPGGLISGTGAGMLFAFGSSAEGELLSKIGILLISIAAGWGLITAGSFPGKGKTAWWALVPGGIFAAAGACLLFSDRSFLAFVLYLTTGIGVILLVWGLFWRLYGLIIPASLLVTIGPGIFIAWGTNTAVNPLSKTGLMIAAFSFGWGLIVFFARIILAKFVWWPLIPGGVMAMVGWGLYIGGDPGGAPSFIANTGSVALIIFGLYLLLLRKSIHR